MQKDPVKIALCKIPLICYNGVSNELRAYRRYDRGRAGRKKYP